MTTESQKISIKNIIQRCLTRIEESSTKESQECEVKCTDCQDYGYIWGGLGVYPEKCACVITKSKEEQKRKAVNLFSDEYKDFKISSFSEVDKFQRMMKEKARAFINTKGIFSIIFLGQSGCGKTHLCIGIANELIQKGANIEFMSYPEWILKLKQNMFNKEGYGKMIYKFKKCDYLVIDDFLKSATKKGEINDTDLQLVFEIIDYRYRYKKPVIISSEYFLDEISDRSESIAGRLKQMATHQEDSYIVEIGRDKKRNYRLKGVQRI